MLKKKVLSLACAAAMMISSISGIVAEAAEKCYDPWTLYSAPLAEDTTTANWMKPKMEFFNGDATKPFISCVTGSPVNSVNISTGVGGTDEVFICMGADSQAGLLASGGIGGGSPVAAFKAEEAGEYTLKMYSTLVWDNAAVIGNALVGIMNGSSVEIKDTVSLQGGAAGTVLADYTKAFDLKKGESLVTKFNTTADSWNRAMWVKYSVITPDGTEYKLNNMATTVKIAVPESELTQNEWKLGSYNSVTNNQNSVWSIYLAGTADNNDPAPNRAASGLPSTNDRETWLECPIENHRDDSNGFFVQSGVTQLKINDALPNGYFFWRAAADSESNGRGTTIIGWTAPEAGEYVIEAEGKDVGTDVTTPAATNHYISYQKAGDANPTILDYFAIPGSESGEIGRYTSKYSLEKGETVYLFNDANWTEWGHALYMNYRITNANDPSEVYSVSDIAKQDLTNSPYALWYSAHGQTSIADYYRSGLTETDGTASTEKADNYIKINADNTVSLMPLLNNTADAIGECNSISFDVPADGYYKVDFNFEVSLDETQGGAVAIADLSHLSGYTNTLSATTGVASVQINMQNRGGAYSGIVNAKKGDKLYLTMTSVGAEFTRPLNGNMVISKLGKFNYSFTKNGKQVNSAAELSAGDVIKAECIYLDDAPQTMTLIVAAYNSDKTMKEVSVSEPVTSVPENAATVFAEMTVPEDADIIKMFIVNDLNTFIPLDLPEQI